MTAAVKVPPSSLPGYSEDGPWFYNALTGALVHEAGVPGFFEDLVTRLPGDWYGFKTQADATSAAAAEGWAAPTGSDAQAAKNVTSKAADNLAGGLFTVQGSGFSSWFRRGLKIGLGAMLIIVGLSRLTGLDNAATRAAGKVPVVPL